MKNFNCVPLLLISIAVLAGCAGDGGRPVSDTSGSVASIEVARKAKTSSGDCPVTITVTNRTGTTWDGVSYHLAMNNRNGAATGRLLGSPRKKTASGDNLVDNGSVLGMKCEEIAGMALVYFGYYPAGKKQVHAHINTVRVTLR